MPQQAAPHVELETIELKDPGLAALLAWLLPGLGHWYQGRRAKAIVFFVCIMGLFAYGVYLSSSSEKCRGTDGKIGYGRAVYFSWRTGDVRLYFLGQVGVGLPTLPALVQAHLMSSHRRVWFGGFMAPPWFSDYERDRVRQQNPQDPNLDQPSIGELHRQLHRYFELGTVFTMFAGLLNVLAIYDAWAGPVVMTEPKKEEAEEEEATTEASAST